MPPGSAVASSPCSGLLQRKLWAQSGAAGLVLLSSEYFLSPEEASPTVLHLLIASLFCVSLMTSVREYLFTFLFAVSPLVKCFPIFLSLLKQNWVFSLLSTQCPGGKALVRCVVCMLSLGLWLVLSLSSECLSWSF